MYRDERDEVIQRLTQENVGLKNEGKFALGLRYILKAGVPISFVSALLVFGFMTVAFCVHKHAEPQARLHVYEYRDEDGRQRDRMEAEKQTTISAWEVLDYTLTATFAVFGAMLAITTIASLIIADSEIDRRNKVPEEKKA